MAVPMTGISLFTIAFISRVSAPIHSLVYIINCAVSGEYFGPVLVSYKKFNRFISLNISVLNIYA